MTTTFFVMTILFSGLTVQPVQQQQSRNHRQQTQYSKLTVAELPKCLQGALKCARAQERHNAFQYQIEREGGAPRL